VLTQAKAGGADYAELYVERYKRRYLRMLLGGVQEANSGIEFGAGLRLFFGTDVVYAYTNDLTPESLSELTRTLLKLKQQALVDAGGAGGLDFRKALAKGLHSPKIPLSSQDKRFRVERLREAAAGAQIGPAIKQVQTILIELEQDILVATSEGLWVEDSRIRTRYMVQAIAESERGTKTGFNGPGLSMGLELFEKHPPAEAGRIAAKQALVNLGAKPAPAGTMPVVVGNAFGGVIFHEALGHLLETTAVAKNISVLSEKIGQVIASECVTYIDEGTTPHGWGSQEFDDEGLPTQHTVLVRNGKLESYIVDRRGALQTGYKPTGSGRRQNYTYAPASRMRNTYIAPGTTPKEKLFEGIEFGLYAATMGGGQVKPGSGEYNFAVEEGYIIRNGRIEEPVRGALLVGKGPDTIRKVVAVSDDLSTSPGMCGSVSGSIPTEVGQPHLLISEIVVGGQA
jgi:TldD protein